MSLNLESTGHLRYFPDSEFLGKRFFSLDIYKGIATFFMFFVNIFISYNHTSPFLRHATWNGANLADFILPVFLFATGIGIVLYQKKGNIKWLRVLRQFTVLWLIGYALNVTNHFFYVEPNDVFTYNLKAIRISGPLQRIAIGYLLAMVIVNFCLPKTILKISAAIIAVYAIVSGVFFCQDQASCSMLFLLDLLIMPALQVSQMELKGWMEPDSVPSSLLSLVNILAGYLTMYAITAKKQINLWWVAIALIIGGAILNYIIPINRILWSPSFILVSCGVPLVLFLLFKLLCHYKPNFFVFKGLAYFGKHSLFYFAFPLFFNLPWAIITMVIRDTGGLPIDLRLNFIHAISLFVFTTLVSLILQIRFSKKSIPQSTVNPTTT